MDIHLQVGDQVPPGLHGQPGQCAARLVMVAPGQEQGTAMEALRLKAAIYSHNSATQHPAQVSSNNYCQKL